MLCIFLVGVDFMLMLFSSLNVVLGLSVKVDLLVCELYVKDSGVVGLLIVVVISCWLKVDFVICGKLVAS